MPQTTGEQWNARIHQFVQQTESEAQRLIDHLNDEVVPEVRRETANALDRAGSALKELSRKLHNTPR